VKLFRLGLAVWFGVVPLWASHARAQTVGTATGSIVGTARDATTSVLSGVEVVVSGAPLMGPRRTATNAAGEYRVVALPPGDYTVSFLSSGFVPLAQAVGVRLGATTTVDATLTVAAQREAVTVTALSTLDRHSAAIADTFTAAQLDDLPSSRSLPGLLTLTHGLQVPSAEVGGSNGIFSGGVNAYGKSTTPRYMVEGIVVTGLFGFGFTLDYGSFEEVSVLTAGHGAEWPTTGIHTEIVTKSGGNQYRGTLFAGYENRAWQSFNVDDDQVGRVAPSGGGLSAREANRLWAYHDVGADAGGYILRDRLWWYSSVRRQEMSSRLVNFPALPYRTALANAGGKITYRVAPGNTLVAYGQRGHNHQPHRLDPFAASSGDLSSATAINETADSTSNQRNVGWVWKAAWNSIVSDSTLVEARAGQFGNEQRLTPRSTAPRFEDVETLVVSGGNRDWHAATRRNQVFGSLSHLRDGWLGGHHFKLGGEAIRFLVKDSLHSGYPGNVLHVIRSGVPSSVFLFDPPVKSEGGVWSYSAYASDSWRLRQRLTLNLGLRFDRYRLFLPAQEHPPGSPDAQQFAAVDNVIDWNMLVPRLAAVYDVTGQGRTLAKVVYARYRGAPNANLAFNANPNTEWWVQHEWTDFNGSGVWEPGEHGRPLRRRGGVAVESVDPALELPVLEEAGVWIEHELPGVVGVRTGVVWRHERQYFARQNANQPFSAFTVPVSIQDPGPDGTAGTSDDGQTFGAYDLPPAFGVPAVNIVRNVPGARSEYWTWEVDATRRSGDRWSFGAGYTHTWNRDQAAGYLQQSVRNSTYPLTPNDLINTGEGGRHEFTTWTAKAHGTVLAPWGIRVSPILRHQSGQPYGRTFKTNSSQIRYTPAVTVLAEPVGTRRTDNVTLVDLRLEKRVRLTNGHQFAGFIDVFNALNANPEQNVIWSSGESFLRPLSIVSPRIVMAGLKFDW
jgi:hypothetical protein